MDANLKSEIDGLSHITHNVKRGLVKKIGIKLEMMRKKETSGHIGREPIEISLPKYPINVPGKPDPKIVSDPSASDKFNQPPPDVEINSNAASKQGFFSGSLNLIRKWWRS